MKAPDLQRHFPRRLEIIHKSTADTEHSLFEASFDVSRIAFRATEETERFVKLSTTRARAVKQCHEPQINDSDLRDSRCMLKTKYMRACGISQDAA